MLSLIGLRERAPTLGQRLLGPAALIVSGLCLGQVLGATIADRSYAERFFRPETPPAPRGHAAIPDGMTRTPIDR